MHTLSCTADATSWTVSLTLLVEENYKSTAKKSGLNNFVEQNDPNKQTDCASI